MISNVIWHCFFSDITKHVSSHGINLQTLIPEFFETCMLQRLRNESLLIMTVECYKSVSNMLCLQWCYWLQDSNVVSLQWLVNFISPVTLSRSPWLNVISKSSIWCGSWRTQRKKAWLISSKVTFAIHHVKLLYSRLETRTSFILTKGERIGN